VQSSILQLLHGSETWPVRKENEVALQQAEMRMVRWMCGVKRQDRVPSKGLRERLGLVKGAMPRIRRNQIWKEIVEKSLSGT